jgi:hypothetical protein
MKQLLLSRISGYILREIIVTLKKLINLTIHVTRKHVKLKHKIKYINVKYTINFLSSSAL